MGRKNRSRDRKSTRLNSSHANISYAVFCLKKKNKQLRRAPSGRGDTVARARRVNCRAPRSASWARQAAAVTLFAFVLSVFFFFFLNDRAPPEISPLPLPAPFPI